MTLQMQTGEPIAVDLTCPTCRGKGLLGSRDPSDDAHECEACSGTGIVPCQECDDAPATEVSTDKRLLCRDCLCPFVEAS